MNIEFVARKDSLTDPVRELTEKKLRKLEKYFREIIDVHVEIDQERHLHRVDISIHGKNIDVRAHAENKDLNAAVQDCVDKLEHQARRARTKVKDRRKGADGAHAAPDWSVDVLEADSIASGSPRIVKTSTIPVKPMTIDEARLQLEDSRNDFIVFLNADSSRVNVLYRRQDDNLGLITPEL